MPSKKKTTKKADTTQNKNQESIRTFPIGKGKNRFFSLVFLASPRPGVLALKSPDRHLRREDVQKTATGLK